MQWNWTLVANIQLRCSDMKIYDTWCGLLSNIFLSLIIGLVSIGMYVLSVVICISSTVKLYPRSPWEVQREAENWQYLKSKRLFSDNTVDQV